MHDSRKKPKNASMNTDMEDTTAGGIGLPLSFMDVMALGCSLLNIPLLIYLKRNMMRTTFREPLVDAEHPPMNMSIRNSIWQNEGQMILVY